jgi:hypothetical protein
MNRALNRGAAVMLALGQALTLGVISLPQTVVPSLVAEMPYDTKRDIAPVTQVLWTSSALVVRSDSSLRSLPDLIAAAKASPGRLTFASGGNGTPPHLVGALLMTQAGLDLQHVPYTGAAAGVAAVLGGQVDMGFPGVAAVTSQVRSGKLRALASTGRVRSAALPDVPWRSSASRGLRSSIGSAWSHQRERQRRSSRALPASCARSSLSPKFGIDSRLSGWSPCSTRIRKPSVRSYSPNSRNGRGWCAKQGFGRIDSSAVFDRIASGCAGRDASGSEARPVRAAASRRGRDPSRRARRPAAPSPCRP